VTQLLSLSPMDLGYCRDGLIASGWKRDRAVSRIENCVASCFSSSMQQQALYITEYCRAVREHSPRVTFHLRGTQTHHVAFNPERNLLHDSTMIVVAGRPASDVYTEMRSCR
jgi:hypothetical protein